MIRRRCMVFSGFVVLSVALLGLGLGPDTAAATRGERTAPAEVPAEELLDGAWDTTPFDDLDDARDDNLAFRRAVGDGVASARREAPTKLPERLDNSVLKYFPPILKQAGGSCAQQAAVHNCYCYEVNLLRDLDARFIENQYPAHWTWNCLNNADGKGSNGNAGWKIINEMGVPSVDVYGDRYGLFKDAGWISGYDKYYKAMHNRIAKSGSLPMRTIADLEKVKGYLFNHNDPNNKVGGVLYFSMDWKNNKKVKIPTGQYEAGKTLITAWGKDGGHAMTYVGYDDNVGYDINGDGKITNDIDITGDGKVDLADWERGAFIFADSKGTGYGDQGKAYVMYRVCALKEGTTRPNVSWVRPLENYQPRITMMLKFTCNDRSALRLSAGASGDPAAASPSATFKPGIYNGVYKVGSVPVRGKDNHEPIEIGLDVSQFGEVLSGLDTGKFFLKLACKDGSKAKGELLAAAVRYYDAEGRLVRVRNFTIADGNFGEQALDLAIAFRPQ
jgi:hypothetical protein